MLFNQHIDDLRYAMLKSWVLKDVGLRLLSMVVPVENKHRLIQIHMSNDNYVHFIIKKNLSLM